MPKDTKKIAPINYLSKEFAEIRSDLIQLAQRYYPDQFQDFSESSFGAMMVDAVAYVGDQFSPKMSTLMILRTILLSLALTSQLVLPLIMQSRPTEMWFLDI